MKPDIELHIDGLILHGFPAADRHRIGEAVERELALLLSERGVPMGCDQDVHIDRLDGGRMRLSASVEADALGAEIARSLYGLLERNGENGHSRSRP